MGGWSGTRCPDHQAGPLTSHSLQGQTEVTSDLSRDDDSLRLVSAETSPYKHPHTSTFSHHSHLPPSPPSVNPILPCPGKLQTQTHGLSAHLPTLLSHTAQRKSLSPTGHCLGGPRPPGSGVRVGVRGLPRIRFHMQKGSFLKAPHPHWATALIHRVPPTAGERVREGGMGASPSLLSPHPPCAAVALRRAGRASGVAGDTLPGGVSPVLLAEGTTSRTLIFPLPWLPAMAGCPASEHQPNPDALDPEP